MSWSGETGRGIDGVIDIKQKTDCCGCGACIQICPQKCIAFVQDEEGFFYPEADFLKCVQCGKCEKVWPIKSASAKKRRQPSCYIGYHKEDAVRFVSSSGGIFTPLAEYVICEMQGVVFGGAYDDTFMVRHTRVDKTEMLDILRGSKYVQSQTGQAYQEAEADLKKDKTVLYTGTPCQIAGLKKYLGKEYSGLYTVEVLCHGVPGPGLWRQYLDEKEKHYQGKVTYVSFRQMKSKWTSFAMELQFDNGVKYEKDRLKDPYMQMFLNNLSLRPACYDCQYKDIDKREADLTIGDCWGIETYMPDMFDDKGTSVIFVHSEKGRKLLEQIRKKLILREGEADRAVSPGAESRKSPLPHPKRKVYLEKVKKGKSISELAKVTKRSLPERIKTKIERLLETGGRRDNER